MAAGFEAEDRTFGQIFKEDHPYRVPQYQRPYTWDEDEFVEFWDDLIGTADTNFIGALIFNYEYVSTAKYIDIIDGQQRLITTTIFAAVLRDIAKALEKGGDGLVGRIQERFIAFSDIRGRETYKILCGTALRDFLENHVQSINAVLLDSEGRPTVKPATEEQRRVLRCYQYFFAQVKAEIVKQKDSAKTLEFLHGVLERLQSVRIIHVQIFSEVDAYQIFETVNARGADLSVADLLKNLLVKMVTVKHGLKAQAVIEKWDFMESTIKDTGFELSKFVRYYWLSRHEFIQEKQLFKSIKSTTGELEYLQLLDDLVYASQNFKLLIDGDRDDWSEATIQNADKVHAALSGLEVLGIKQCYVLFLSILKNYSRLQTNPQRIFALIEKFSFIYSTICKQPTNRVERIYSKCARDIEKAAQDTSIENVSKNVQTIFNKLEQDLHELMPPYETFISGFMNLKYGTGVKDRGLVKYVLTRINDYYSTGETIINPDQVNIEHVLPQKPAESWGLKDSDIKPYVNLLGNLTIVDKKINSRAGNKSLPEKINLLKTSELNITKQFVKSLGESTNWSAQDIKKRQEQLAELAYTKIWKY